MVNPCIMNASYRVIRSVLLFCAALIHPGTARAADNLALSGSGILGVKDSLDSDIDSPFANSGTTANINDGDLTTRVDTYNGGGLQTVSYVGILWDNPVTTPIKHLDLTLALFGNGGWFGVNQTGPSSGGLKDEHLVEPRVEITTDGFVWTPVASTSDYYLALRGHAIGAPNSATARFTLAQPAQNIVGIRLAGTEGGTVSGGFLGVFELAVLPAFADSDNDGMEDDWETKFGLRVGENDAAADPDGDGVTNLQEYQLALDPTKADTDGDGLADGAEVNIHHTNAQRIDTDGDSLTDNDEISKYKTNPVSKDTDNDGFADSLELSSGADPLNPGNYPPNIAILGTGILGGKEALDGGPETEHPFANSGSPANVNDGNLVSRVDTYGPGHPVSYVGVVWPKPISKPISMLDLTLALFSNGGWFGPNGIDPGAGGKLTAAHLAEPQIEVSNDGGATWTVVPHTSDYLATMTGQGIGGGTNPNPNPVTITFTLTQPATNINGIRIVGTDGGTAGGGFLGVFELATRSIPFDSDNDGLDDAWERTNGLIVGTNDSSGDPDDDGLTNLEEFNAKTDPQKGDTDVDGLKDGAEVKTNQTNPLRADTDGDGLSDGDEVTIQGTDPLKKDTDGDGFSDVVEVAEGTDAKNSSSLPANIASLGHGILGKKDSFDGDASGEAPVYNSGNASNINDGLLNTRVDTYGRGEPLSYVGILWDQPIKDPVADLKLTLALFSNGGWFGTPGEDPGAGKLLTADYLEEPKVQITTDGGATWTEVPHFSDYLATLTGKGIGGGAVPNPNPVKATFTLTQPAKDINGIRIAGSNGGSAGGGFLGVFELSVDVTRSPSTSGVSLVNTSNSNGQFRFEFDSHTGASHLVEFKTSLSDAAWQTHSTVPGDGTRKQITSPADGQQRFFRVSN